MLSVYALRQERRRPPPAHPYNLSRAHRNHDYCFCKVPDPANPLGHPVFSSFLAHHKPPLATNRPLEPWEQNDVWRGWHSRDPTEHWYEDEADDLDPILGMRIPSDEDPSRCPCGAQVFPPLPGGVSCSLRYRDAFVRTTRLLRVQDRMPNPVPGRPSLPFSGFLPLTAIPAPISLPFPPLGPCPNSDCPLRLEAASPDRSCVVCAASGHSSLICRDARLSPKSRLIFRALTIHDLRSLSRGEDLRGFSYGALLHPSRHGGGGNVRIRSRWFSSSFYLDVALSWGAKFVKNAKTATKSRSQYHASSFLIADASLCDIAFDVSSRLLTSRHRVVERWAPLTIDSAELILSRVPQAAILHVWHMRDLLASNLPAPLPPPSGPAWWYPIGSSQRDQVLEDRLYEITQWAADFKLPRPVWLPS